MTDGGTPKVTLQFLVDGEEQEIETESGEITCLWLLKCLCLNCRSICAMQVTLYGEPEQLLTKLAADLGQACSSWMSVPRRDAMKAHNIPIYTTWGKISNCK